MIIYIGPNRGTTYFLRSLRRDSRMPAWKCKTISWLFRTRRLPAATYIFLAVDRLDIGERRLAGQFYRHINALGPGWRALNDPSVAMGRYRLLRSLHEAGINDFNAYLVADGTRPASFPVFIRRNGSNTPPLTGLLMSRAELDRQIDRLVAAGEVPEALVVIEYCSEEFMPNVFRRQAEYRVADHFIATPTIYAGQWIAKFANKVDVPRDLLSFDEEVLEQNPFEAAARQAFEIAGIEYGRADFGIVNGRPQFYEINFNPDLRTEREKPYDNGPMSDLFDQTDTRFFKALSAISGQSRGTKKSLSSKELLAFRLRFWRNYAPERY